MWDILLVAAVVLAALAVVAYRLWRVLTGRFRCACPRARHCASAKDCKDAGAEERRPARE